MGNILDSFLYIKENNIHKAIVITDLKTQPPIRNKRTIKTKNRILGPRHSLLIKRTSYGTYLIRGKYFMDKLAGEVHSPRDVEVSNFITTDDWNRDVTKNPFRKWDSL